MIGYSYEEAKEDVFSNKTFYGIWEDTIKGSPTISGYCDDPPVVWTYFFDRNNKCNVYVVIYTNYANINNTISSLNNKYVKEGELKWKDYRQTPEITWEIIKEDKCYKLRASR